MLLRVRYDPGYRVPTQLTLVAKVTRHRASPRSSTCYKSRRSTTYARDNRTPSFCLLLAHERHVNHHQITATRRCRFAHHSPSPRASSRIYRPRRPQARSLWLLPPSPPTFAPYGIKPHEVRAPSASWFCALCLIAVVCSAARSVAPASSYIVHRTETTRSVVGEHHL